MTILVVLAVAPCSAASKPRLVVERIAATGAGVRVFASLAHLEGQIDASCGPDEFMLFAGESPLGSPRRATPFEATGERLDLVVVVESSALYAPQTAGQRPERQPLEYVKEAVETLLGSLPPRCRVLVIDYGGEVKPHPPFRPPAAAASSVANLNADDDAGPPQLTNSVRAALKVLGADRDAHARRAVVVVSDGLNAQMDRNTFRSIGDQAAKAILPIHSIAFSPIDERAPLLNLGEISKRSHGTFRWARTSRNLREQLQTLADELNRQYVLDFDIDADHIDGRSVALAKGDLRSNVVVVDIGDDERRRRSILRWCRRVAGVLALVALFLVIAAARRRRSRSGRAHG